jgi:hypothetical protein
MPSACASAPALKHGPGETHRQPLKPSAPLRQEYSANVIAAGPTIPEAEMKLEDADLKELEDAMAFCSQIDWSPASPTKTVGEADSKAGPKPMSPLATKSGLHRTGSAPPKRPQAPKYRRFMVLEVSVGQFELPYGGGTTNEKVRRL